MGASGAGKDSVLTYARQHIRQNEPVIFCHRYITRNANAGGENHIELTEQEFNFRLRHGCFIMNWNSHGQQYGIGIEVNDWMQQGLDVVVNGSRQYFNHVLKGFPNIIPVEVTVSSTILAHRLRQRGRESSEGIAERIERSRLLDDIVHPDLVQIENNSTIEAAGSALIEVISCRKGT